MNTRYPRPTTLNPSADTTPKGQWALDSKPGQEMEAALRNQHRKIMLQP